MRALTIHPWWAALIVSGHKTTENRVWAPSLSTGERFAIHAGSKRPTRDDWDRVRWQLERVGLPVGMADDLLAAPRGAIIGTVVYAGCDTSVLSPWDIGIFDGRQHHHWRVCSPDACDPIPCSGAMGLWRAPDHVAARLMPNAAAPA